MIDKETRDMLEECADDVIYMFCKLWFQKNPSDSEFYEPHDPDDIYDYFFVDKPNHNAVKRFINRILARNRI